MNFDKFLVLEIITYCSYRDIIRWKRLNSFFKNSINNISFWELYKQRRCNPVSYKVKCIGKDFLKRQYTKKYDNLDDIYDVIGHFLLQNINEIDCMEFKMDNIYHFIYQSPEFVWSWHLETIKRFNEYRSENDGLGEEDYDPETGLPYYYNDLIDEPEFDDSYKSIASTKLSHILKKEDTAFVIPEPTYRMNYECLVIERKSVIGALPDSILGKIFSYVYFEKNQLQTPLLYLVSKKFNRIFLTYVCPPFANASKGLLHACRKDHLSYFNKWRHLAGNRLNIQEAFLIAFLSNSVNILDSMQNINLSCENLKLICLNTSVLEQFLPNISRDNIPKMIKEAKRINNGEAISLLRNAYNNKLIEKSKHRYYY